MADVRFSNFSTNNLELTRILQPVYNATTPKGGDAMQVDVNQQYSSIEFNYVYIVACSFVVWLIIPGVGLLYSGLSRRKSALSLLVQCFTASAVYVFPHRARSKRELITSRTTVQWMFWGYTLAYSRDGGPFIGTLQSFGLKNVLVAPSPESDVLPEIVYCYFQLLFCACTVRPYHVQPQSCSAVHVYTDSRA